MEYRLLLGHVVGDVEEFYQECELLVKYLDIFLPSVQDIPDTVLHSGAAAAQVSAYLERMRAD